MVSGNGSRCAWAGKLSRAMHACSTHMKRRCMPCGHRHLSPWASGTAKWWEKLLGLGPRASLVQELGAQHNVTLQAFAHAACLVRHLPSVITSLFRPCIDQSPSCNCSVCAQCRISRTFCGVETSSGVGVCICMSKDSLALSRIK